MMTWWLALIRRCRSDSATTGLGPVNLHIEPEHRMPVVALRVHEHRLAQPLPDGPQKSAEHIESLLPLELPQIDVKVDLLRRKEAEDRAHIGCRPDLQFCTLGISRTGQHCLCPRHRHHDITLGILAPPPARVDEVKDRLPVLHRGVRHAYVRQ